MITFPTLTGIREGNEGKERVKMGIGGKIQQENGKKGEEKENKRIVRRTK